VKPSAKGCWLYYNNLYQSMDFTIKKFSNFLKIQNNSCDVPAEYQGIKKKGIKKRGRQTFQKMDIKHTMLNKVPSNYITKFGSSAQASQ
jgi:hypothetical protein